MKKILFLILIIFSFYNLLLAQTDNKLHFFLKDAYEADSLEQYDKEIEILNNIIKEYPNSDSAYARRSRVKLIIQDLDGAMKDIKIALKLNPKSSYAYYRLGYIYYHQEKFKDAIIEFDNAINLNSNNEVFFRERGNANYNLNNWQLAIDDYTQALILNPKKSYCNLWRGNAYANIHKYEASILDYNRTLELQPKNINAYFNRGNAKRNLDDYNGAIEDYIKAIEINNEYEQAYLKIIDIYDYLDKYNECSIFINKLINVIPNNFDYLQKRAFYYQRLGNYNDAIADYSQILKIDTNKTLSEKSAIYLKRGIAYNNNENFELAIKDFNLAILLDDEDVESYYRRALTNLKIGNYINANNDFVEVISLNKNNGNGEDTYISFADLEVLFKFINKTNDKIEGYKNHASTTNCLIGLGKIKKINGDFNDALKYFQRALKIYPENEDIIELIKSTEILMKK